MRCNFLRGYRFVLYYSRQDFTLGAIQPMMYTEKEICGSYMVNLLASMVYPMSHNINAANAELNFYANQTE